MDFQNQIPSRIIGLLFLIFFVFGIADIKCQSIQSFNTAAYWNHIEYGNRVAALGQASSALGNRVAFHSNPAILVESGSINISSYLTSSNPVPRTGFIEPPTFFNPSASIGLDKWSFAVKMDYTQWGSNGTGFNSSNFSNDTRIIRFNASRELFDNFSIGLGISHIHDNDDFTTGVSGVNANGFMFSTGIHYNHPFPLFGIKLNPQIGIALTDIGDKLSYNVDGQNPQTGQSISGTKFLTPPGQLRTSVGLDIATQEKIANQHFIQIGLYLGFNKYMSGFNELDNSDDTYSLISGLNMITSTWRSFERFDGVNTNTVNVSDQISKSYGIELGLMETLYFQIGRMGGAELWVSPQTNYGVTLDLYYVALSFTNFNYDSSDTWNFGEEPSTAVWNIDLRIPIDGAPRNTIINPLLDWLRN